MADYQLELRQIVDYPRCRIYREFMQTLIADRSIRTGGCSNAVRLGINRTKTPLLILIFKISRGLFIYRNIWRWDEQRTSLFLWLAR